MLATIRDDTWNMRNMQHITTNSKLWDYSDSPVGGTEMIKGHAYMVEGDHHLRKHTNPHPHFAQNIPGLSVMLYKHTYVNKYPYMATSIVQTYKSLSQILVPY